MYTEPLQAFSWGQYGAVAFVYSLFSLTGFSFKGRGRVFSKENARSVQQVLTIHLKSLTFLLLWMWATAAIGPHLPDWMTDTFVYSTRRHSLLDLSFAAVMTIAGFVEWQLVYVKRGPDADGQETASS